MPLHEDYRERLYRDYSRTHGAAAPDATAADPDPRVLESHFGRFLPEDRGARILELGCGAGAFLRFLRARGHRAIEGVERDEGSLAAARARGTVEAVRGDAVEALRARPGSCACVVAVDFLEHFRKDELFPLLDLVAAALVPGPDSAFVGRVPNADGVAWGRVRYGDLTHELAFTANSLRQALRAAGFDAIEVRAEEPVVTGARSLLRWLLWKPLRAALRLSLFAESYAHEGALLTPNLIFRARRTGTRA